MAKVYVLEDTRRDCMASAETLPGYKNMSVDELANGYCAALDKQDEFDKNRYMSALLLRFWYKINELYIGNKSLNLDYGDYFAWIAGAIMLACAPDRRTWQTSDTVNATQVIMQTLNTRFKAAAYYEANLDIHKANYNSVSLDDPITSGDADEETTLLDTLQDSGSENFARDIEVEHLIQSMINDNQLIEAIITDTIAFNDVQKTTKKMVKITNSATGEIKKISEVSSEFWPYRLVQILNTLPDNYAKYFTSKYAVDNNLFNIALSAMKKSNNNKLYRSVAKTISKLKVAMAV